MSGVVIGGHGLSVEDVVTSYHPSGYLNDLFSGCGSLLGEYSLALASAAANGVHHSILPIIPANAKGQNRLLVGAASPHSRACLCRRGLVMVRLDF